MTQPAPRSPFRRTVVAVAATTLAAVALGTLPGGAQAASAVVGSRSASVARDSCTTSLADPQQRSASFTVVMRRQADTKSFSFAAILQERPAGGRWTDLSGAQAPPGLNRPQQAKSGAAVMQRRFNVRGLRLGSTYRMQVSYLWETTSGGHSSVSRTSRTCKVADPRPNLKIGTGVGWVPAPTGGQVLYRVPVTTSRLAALGSDVDVVVRQGTTILGATTFRPGSAHDVTLVPGTRCDVKQPLTVEVDPNGKVDERDEQDNAVVVPCRTAVVPAR